MKLNSLIGWGVAIGGGYLLLKSLGYDPLTYFTGTSVGAGQVVNTGGATTVSPQANDTQLVSNQASLKAAIASKLTQDKVDLMSYKNVDFWNYYYQMVKGIAAPAPEELFPSNDRNATYTFSQWFDAIAGKGLSGMKGIGMIARVNPFELSFVNHYGSSIAPNGIENIPFRRM